MFEMIENMELLLLEVARLHNSVTVVKVLMIVLVVMTAMNLLVNFIRFLKGR